MGRDQSALWRLPWLDVPTLDNSAFRLHLAMIVLKIKSSRRVKIQVSFAKPHSIRRHLNVLLWVQWAENVWSSWPAHFTSVKGMTLEACSGSIMWERSPALCGTMEKTLISASSPPSAERCIFSPDFGLIWLGVARLSWQQRLLDTAGFDS